MIDFEQLGLFYLGRTYDLAKKLPGNDLVLYDSRDLVTHAVCVGMTGSGKTGLCISLLEEAIIDHIPAIAIDPKGDLANLLLTFPQLRGEDFAPWVDEGEAKRAGLTPEAFAEQQAELWKKGLAEWGEDGERIARLRESGEFRVYTPGSRMGLPLSILKSFDAPSPAVLDDPEALGERVVATASSLLGMLGKDADPVQSREHILIATILTDAWKAGNSVDIPALIHLIQKPPFNRVGVIDVDSFFPPKDRFALAQQLNNLLASPGFEAWLDGEPLDIDAMLYSPEGKPRLSIVSVAHLDDSQRMFFVTLLLDRVLSWARSQPGTGSLRALLYMDEIFGYFPPVANPPSKRPLLTLLKQARAYGLGIVLATQNPADLDYKGLSNTGTWFIGRLQTDRDKLRVLDGLEGAATSQSAQFDRQEMDHILSGLGKRVFLMHNVHEDQPVIFQVRWALSYLRGPLTRQQIKQLMDPVRAASDAQKPSLTTPKVSSDLASTASTPPGGASSTEATESQRPLLPPEIPQYFGPTSGKGPLVYRPMLFGSGEVYYSDTKSGASTTRSVSLLATFSDDAVGIDWSAASRVNIGVDDLEKEPASVAAYESPPPAAAKMKSYTAWAKSFANELFRNEPLELWKSTSLGEVSKPGETERDFRLRLQQGAKEARDAELDKLRTKYAPKVSALKDKIRRAEQVVDREAERLRTSGVSSIISIGGSILDAVVGRKRSSSSTITKAGSAANQAMKKSDDLARARENLGALYEQQGELEAQFRADSDKVMLKIDPLTEPLETLAIRPKKANVTTKLVALVWIPLQSRPDGTITPAI
ncbi:ATP-binding protein [Singulisphaera sp. PoT]|uniref:ATP-binding protein n=1 Tax=Singulisphaera sp. PoT TaxID=3411797 RepID=UPI003BF48E0B